MSRAAQYTVVKLDLTVAGKETVHGPWSICRFLDATDGAGDVATSAKVTVTAERGAEPAPVRLGQAFLARNTSRWIIEWDAQSGVTAEFGFAERPENLDWDADPPAKLLTGAVKLKGNATFDTAADVSCTNAAVTEVLAANSARRAAFVQNLDAAASVRIGDSNVAAGRGLRLGPGDSITVETTEAVSVRNDSGAAVLVAVMETAD